MHVQPLGKQTSRIIVKSERTRADLAKLAGVTVDGERVIFPDSMARLVLSIERTDKGATVNATQTELF